MISAGAQLDTVQAEQQHAQEMTALEAERQAYADLRQHGLDQEQAEQNRIHEARMEAQKQLAQQATQQADQAHQAEMQAQQPPTGE